MEWLENKYNFRHAVSIPLIVIIIFVFLRKTEVVFLAPFPNHSLAIIILIHVREENVFKLVSPPPLILVGEA